MSSKTSRVNSFDLLRGIAILGVIVVHTSQAFPTGRFDTLLSLGRFGVQLFFFVSALTMCYMWEARSNELNRIRNFYLRRFFRIAPLFWLAIPLYLAIDGPGRMLWDPDGRGPAQVLITALFLHGFFPDTINTVVPGGWSIAVEMTFYAIFPIMISKVKGKNFYLWSAVTIYFLNILALTPWMMDTLSAHFAGSHRTGIVRDFVYLNFINQAPVFLLGCHLYFQQKAAPGGLVRGLAPIFIGWAIAAFIAFKFFTSDVRAFGFALVMPALYCCVLVTVRLKLHFGPLNELGKHSYAIYLTHFLILYLLPKGFIMMGVETHGVIPFVTSLLITISTTYLLALALHYMVERRAHKLTETLVARGERSPATDAGTHSLRV